MAMIPLLVQRSGSRLCRLPDPDTSRDRFPDHSVDGIFCAAGAQLSQYVEESYAADLLSEATSSVGYLLKDRVAHVRRLHNTGSGDGSQCHADDEPGGRYGRAAARRDDLVPSGKAGGGDQQVDGVALVQVGGERAAVIEALD
jgi:hypothetical protein